jgi:hypothetical protein
VETDRKMSFLLPPLVFFTFFLLGVLFGNHDLKFRDVVYDLLFICHSNGILKLLSIAIPVLAAGGVSFLALGLLISSIPIALCSFCCPHYEGKIGQSRIDFLMRTLKCDTGNIDKNAFVNEYMSYIVDSFDHDIISTQSPKMHEWLQRRWQIFRLSANSATAILMSLVFLLMFQIHFNIFFLVVSMILVACLLWNSRVAWRQTMKMIEFQSFRGDLGTRFL